MLGDYRAVRPRDLGAADDGAEILRIHYRVERDEQAWPGCEQVLEGPFTPRLQLGRHALMHAGRDRVQGIGRHVLDARDARELVEPGIVAEAGGLHDPDHSPGARRLEHRVAAVDHGRPFA